MIVKEEFLNKLRRSFNLNLYEVRIWTALLSRGVSTAGELSDIGRVPRSRAYDVLDSLEKKGFVVMKLGKPIKYIAVEPEEVVERVKKIIRNNAEDNIQKLKDLKKGDVLTELNSLHKQGIEHIEPSDLAGAIKGKQNLYTHMELMMKKARKSITIVTTPKELVRKVELFKSLLQKLNKSKVNIRIVSKITPECENAVKELKGIAEIKNSNDLSARFCIVDGKEVLFMTMHDDDVHPTYDIGVWVNTPFFASALENMLENKMKDMK